MLGTPTRITELINSYKAGVLSLTSLAQQLGSYSYKNPKRTYSEADDEPPEREYGTWDEVRNARNVGLLSSDEYLTIVRVADEQHPTRTHR